MRVVTVAQTRALEEAAVSRGATWAGLMEQAGWGVAQQALALLGQPRGRSALVLAGPGNNGGDGLVVARHLLDAGVRVTIGLWRRAAQDDPQLERCLGRGASALTPLTPARLTAALVQADLVVDGLLGAGANRPVSGDLAALIAALNAAHGPLVLAIDVPSGVHADSGAASVAVRADLTVATGLLKRGVLFEPGRSYAGRVVVAGIGLNEADLEGSMSAQLDQTYARTLLPARPADGHKGTFGTAIVVAGSPIYPGAASLATAAAARVGAGLVTLANGRSSLGNPGRLAEVTLRPLPEDEPGAIGAGAADELLTHLEHASALLIGPGLGNDKPTRAFVERLLGIDAPKQRGAIGFRVGAAQTGEAKPRGELPPLVLDADALNALAQIENWWAQLPAERCVLTPHPGEMRRLLGVTELPEDLVACAEAAAARWNQVVVLKGATTVVAKPGASLIHAGANPALATAGSGDVLAGAVAGLLAQGLAPFDAAALAVYLHGAAGRIVAEEVGAIGAIASDLLLRLPRALTALA